MNSILRERSLPGGGRIAMVHGDITEERVDAIVNAANSHLQHGGGVAGVIVRKGGSVIQEESDAHVRGNGLVPVGQAVATGAGALPCRCVIHAVGPRWGEGDEDEKLRSAARSALALADGMGMCSISLPAISSGIFGFPKDRCAEILLAVADEFMSGQSAITLYEIRFCLYDTQTIDAFYTAWDRRYSKGGT